MMLLAAVVLIFAFLALSAMVSRVSQLASVTSQDQDRPILLEVDSLQDAVQDVLENLETLDFEEAEYESALAGALQHLALLEAARGFRLEAAFSGLDPLTSGECAADGQAKAITVAYALSDGEVRVEFAEVATYTCNVAPPPPP